MADPRNGKQLFDDQVDEPEESLGFGGYGGYGGYGGFGNYGKDILEEDYLASFGNDGGEW